MARQESEKEDLLREATALVERLELAPVDAPQDERVMAGFRRDGAASIFFGADPVYHFNAAAELRRAYCDGLIFKATRGRLVSLRRVRQEGQVQLVRHELSDAECGDFLAQMRSRLRGLANELGRDGYRVSGQVPANADVQGRLKEWLAAHDGSKIAAVPNAERRGKRPNG